MDMQVKFNKLVKCISMFQDFVDVTLVCSDGTRLDAHKVILSSVSSYFRDILKVFLTKYNDMQNFSFLLFTFFSDCAMQTSNYYIKRHLPGGG